ncbi:immunity 26/phosphotriesterase HocA family protein [Bradyrhizobium manausense]|uniref:Imm26 family immunity protein n=1 Tax=Bradyrhizobium TaxID=374 RepID=UPI001BA5663E|nr:MULTISPECIES: Imm26 family immunity protein [Bradyrhizobium]MBR0828437.1 immunity 26/phosphotriesterase HocA family protein [Bradyrhizobium manausense]UVO25500.1 immunity 26/phosphotriesterase HocA family protein [Bradyrhizobium arachidis]
MKLPYEEGSVFLVPVRPNGFLRGVVTRSTSRGRVLVGYFFGPRVDEQRLATVNDLDPQGALARIRFGDLGLINGEWPILGKVERWDRTEWPTPDFVRRDPISNKAWLIRYSDADPLRSTSERLPNYDDFNVLGHDGLYGAGAAEAFLSKLLAS